MPLGTSECSTCSPVEEGTTRLQTGGLAVHLLGGVKAAGSKKCDRWGARSANPNIRRKLVLLGKRGGGGRSAYKCCPLAYPPTPAPAMLHTKPFPKLWRVEGAHQD